MAISELDGSASTNNVGLTLTVLGALTLAGRWSAEGAAQAQAPKGFPPTPTEEET